MALGCQVVDFVRLHFLHDADQVAGVRKIPVVQNELAAFLVRSLIKVVDTIRIEQGRAALDAVDFIALVQKEFRQIGAVLTSDAGNECFLHELRICPLKNRSMKWLAGPLPSNNIYNDNRKGVTAHHRNP